MSWSFPIGRLLGSQLRVHGTFLLLLVWIGYSAYTQGGAQAAAINIVYVLLLFACVIAHEYGHALTARRFGIRTPDITLLPIGGLARLERMPEKPSQEILVALAGPAVNVVIFVVLWLLAGVSFNAAPLTGEMQLADLPQEIATLNLVLVAFNLIPAFPMDGGRVLRAALSIFTKRVTATRIAAWIGQGLAVAFGLWGLYTGGYVLVLIGVFIFMAARAESRDVSLRDLVVSQTAGDVMEVGDLALTPHLDLAKARAAVQGSSQTVFPVVDPSSSRPLGLITRAMLDDPGASGTVANVMEAPTPHVNRNAPLRLVLNYLAQSQVVWVVGPFGEVVGFITRDVIAKRL